jgi:hypothetical protein
MIAHSASSPGYSPTELPALAVSGDGTLAALQESSRVTVLELPSGAAFAEIGADPDAVASEVAWVGTPPRLLVLSRYPAHSTVHLLDPHGPHTIAEIRLETPMRLYATVGGAALAIGSLGAAILAATETHVTLYPFPARSVPIAAGAAAGLFVVALSGSIEEWDPISRMPKRRLRLPRSAAINAVGGSERLVWMTTQQEPARIDVIPLVNRGQPRAHDLPEPIARIASHPRSDIVACVGAETGRLYVIDLDGRVPARVIAPEGIDRVEAIGLIGGRAVGVLAVQTGRPIAVMSADGRELDRSRARRVDDRGERGGRAPSAGDVEPDVADDVGSLAEIGPLADLAQLAASHEPGPDAEDAKHAENAENAKRAERGEPDDDKRGEADEDRGEADEDRGEADEDRGEPDDEDRAEADDDRDFDVEPDEDLGPDERPPDEDFELDERLEPDEDDADEGDPDEDTNDPPAPSVLVIPPPPTSSAPRRDDALAWRGEIVAWSRAVVATGRAAGGRTVAPTAAPRAPLIDAVLARFDLPPSLQPALMLLYAAHLRGEHGAAPIDIARLLGDWVEALGRGDLALHDIARHVRSRIVLSPAVLRVLDELPPTTGALVGDPGGIALLGPCVVVAGDEPLAAIAERYLAQVGGAILAAHDDAQRADLLFEARAYGAAPMLRHSAADTPPNDAAIFVVGDAALAEHLALPRLS